MSCQAITAKGTKCSRKAVKSGLCTQHGKINNKTNNKTKRAKTQSKKDKAKNSRKIVKKLSPTSANAEQQIKDIVKDWKNSNFASSKTNYKIEFDELESDEHYIGYEEALVSIIDADHFEVIYNDERFTQKEELNFKEFVRLYANILKYHPDTSFTILDED